MAESAAARRNRRRRILPGFPRSGPLNDAEIGEYFTGDRIVCLLCGKDFLAITSDHLIKLHGVSGDEYREIFGLRYAQGLIPNGRLPLWQALGGDVERMENMRSISVAKDWDRTRHRTSAVQSRRIRELVKPRPGEMNGRALLTSAQADEIRTSIESTKVLAARHGVTDWTIRDVRGGRSWTATGRKRNRAKL